MAKKRKTSQPVQYLSPENYIRQKSRSLPVYECWINEDWQLTKMAQIAIARQHTNGNISFAVYLVDLFCLGVKDSFFQFNISNTEYEEIIDNQNDAYDFKKIEYSLAHNIIFAGYEFALELNIQPYKQFSKTTMYFLEEDNENIELIDIECGENGKPVVVRGNDNFYEATKLYEKLIKELGYDNVVLKEMDEDSDDLEDEHDFEANNYMFNDHEDLSEYQYLDKETERDEDIKALRKLITSSKKKDFNALDSIIEVTNRLFYNSFDMKTIKNCRTTIDDLIDMDVNENYVDDFIGVDSIHHQDIYDEVARLIGSDLKKDLPTILDLINQYPEVPLMKYFHVQNMELQNKELDNESEILALIDKYLAIHPDYFALRLKRDFFTLRIDGTSKVIESFLQSGANIYEYFMDKDLFHPIEYYEFVMALFEYYAINKKYLELDSLTYYLSTVQIEHFALFGEIHLTNLMLKTDFCNKKYVKVTD